MNNASTMSDAAGPRRPRFPWWVWLGVMGLLFRFSPCALGSALSGERYLKPRMHQATLWAWPSGEDAAFQAQPQGNGWDVWLSTGPRWVAAALPYESPDATLKAQVCLQSTDPEQTWAGVFCRGQGLHQAVFFVVTGDGYYGIVQMQEGQPLVRNPKPRLDYGAQARCHTLVVVCRGPVVRMEMDGQYRVRSQAPAPQPGRPGLFVALSGPGRAFISFREVELWLP